MLYEEEEMRLQKLLGVVGMLALFFCTNGWAQVSGGAISGSVLDASGSAIGNAKVKIMNVDTGLTREVVSDDAGRYVAPQLPVGNYSVEASQTGFQTEVRKGLELTIGRDLVVNLELTVGSINQQVEVTEAVPQVETTNASVAYLVDEKKIEDLPLNGRNYTQLATLQPGVSGFNLDRRDGVTGNGNGMSLSGTQTRQNLFLMDGQDMNDSSGGTPGSAAGTNLGVDAIREFTVTTTNYSTEYGVVLGGIFNVVTRSGSNQLHGSVFEYIRNSALDAKNYFDLPGRIPPFRRNQFGGTVSGPIRKDKTFFLGAYEGLRQLQSNTLLNFVPNVAAHGGCLPNSAATTIDTQCANFSAPMGKGLTYVGVSPIMAPRIGVIPLPNGTDQGDGTGRYTTASPATFGENYVLARIDHQISTNNSIFGRYIGDFSTGHALNGIPIFAAQNTTHYQFLTLNWTSVINTNLVNQLRGSINRSNAYANGLNLTGLSDDALSWVTGSTPTWWTGKAGTFILASPIMAFGASVPGEQGGSFNETPRHWAQTMYEFGDTVNYTHGRHSIRAGASFQRYLFNVSMNNRISPSFTSLRAMLLGTPASVSAKVDYSSNSWQNILFGWFIQDDIRISRRVVLNVGLRHEFVTPPYEKYGHASNLINLFTDSTLTVTPTPFTPRKANFAPRVGIAWDVFGNGRTAIRAGAGVFQEQDVITTLRVGFSSLYPFSKSYTFIAPPTPIVNTDNLPPANISAIRWDSNPKTPTKYQWSLNIQQQLDAHTSFSAAYVGFRGVHFLFRKEANPFVPEICPCTDTGDPLHGNVKPNPAAALLPAGTKYFPAWYASNGNKYRFNPNFTSIGTNMEWGADSYYHALQLNLLHQFSRGLQFQAAYTYSKTIDTGSSSWLGAVSGSQATGVEDPYNYQGERGLSANDIRHFFTSNITYDVPFGSKFTGIAGVFAKGWQINALPSYNSGVPFTIRNGFSQSHDGQPGGPADRPNLTPGMNANSTSGVSVGCGNIAAGTPVGTPTLWYDPCAFTLQPAGTYGNLGRNVVVGPSQFNFDTSFSKTFNFTERTRLQFRAEFFNILNHPNFGTMSTTVFTSTGARNNSAGALTTTSTNSRQVQFGLKLGF
jgi:hypothetical protein